MPLPNSFQSSSSAASRLSVPLLRSDYFRVWCSVEKLSPSRFYFDSEYRLGWHRLQFSSRGVILSVVISRLILHVFLSRETHACRWRDLRICLPSGQLFEKKSECIEVYMESELLLGGLGTVVDLWLLWGILKSVCLGEEDILDCQEWTKGGTICCSYTWVYCSQFSHMQWPESHGSHIPTSRHPSYMAELRDTEECRLQAGNGSCANFSPIRRSREVDEANISLSGAWDCFQPLRD